MAGFPFEGSEMDFDALLDVAATAKTAEDLWNAATRYFAASGAHTVFYAQYVPRRPASQVPRHVRVWGGAPDLVSVYETSGLWRRDPLPSLASDWMSARSVQSGQLAPAEKSRTFMELLWPGHSTAAMIAPVFGPGLRHGYIAIDFSLHAPPEMRVRRRLEVASQVLHQHYLRHVRQSEAALPALSAREREVLGWLVHGKSNAEIATILGLSSHTVDTLVRRLYEKLDCNDRTTAAVMAVGAGLISVDGLPAR